MIIDNEDSKKLAIYWRMVWKGALQERWRKIGIVRADYRNQPFAEAFHWPQHQFHIIQFHQDNSMRMELL